MFLSGVDVGGGAWEAVCENPLYFPLNFVVKYSAKIKSINQKKSNV